MHHRMTRFLTILLLFFTINLSAQKAETEQAILLKSANIIDGKGNPVNKGLQILIVGDKIKKIGKKIKTPEGAKIIDCTGKTILPGLIDMHAHMYGNTGGRIEDMFDAYPPLYLAGGITTAFSPGEFDPMGSVNLREKLKNEDIIGPNYLTAGPYFDHDPSQVYWMDGDATQEKTISKFKQWKDKIDAVKIYSSIKEDQFRSVIREAKKEGLFVTGHLSSISAIAAVDMGINGLEHGIFGMSEFWPEGAEYDEMNCKLAELNIEDSVVTNLIDAIIKRGVYIDPTIVIFESLFPDFEPVTEDWMDYLSQKTQERYKRYFLNQESKNLACEQKAVQKQKEFIKALYDKGGLIVTGTDPVIVSLTPGYGLHREIENLVDLGIPPLQALKAATFNGALALRQNKIIGSVEEGKRADLVVVNGNPAEDIKDVGNTYLVIKSGEIYAPDSLRESAKGLIGGVKYSVMLDKAYEAFSEIEKYTEGLKYEDYISDKRTIDAVVLKLIIIGDIATQLPKSLKEKSSPGYWNYFESIKDFMLTDDGEKLHKTSWMFINNHLKIGKQVVKETIEN